MTHVKPIIAWALLASTLPAFAGCLDSSNCSPRGEIPDAEQATASYNICGTVVRWDGAADALSFDEVGDLVEEWSEFHLFVPNGAALGMEHGKPASRHSTVVRGDSMVPFADHAAGKIVAGDTFFFCRHAPDTAQTILISVNADADGSEKNGGKTIPVNIRPC